MGPRQAGQVIFPVDAAPPRAVGAAAPVPQQRALYYAIPTAAQRKLTIRKFAGTELYRGLGSGFHDWGKTFLRQVNLAEAPRKVQPQGSRFLVEPASDARPCGGTPVGDDQDDDYGWPVHETLRTEYACEKVVGRSFLVTGSGQRRCTRGCRPTGTGHIVHHASPELMNVMRAKYDPTRTDYLRHVKELTPIATSIELGDGSVGREVVATHVKTSSQRKESCR
ncbi:unnamed protein product [Albugo candida]|uniref:Uncharacterized protein n=1 Tax=Albugo candida TaxID=65357 RepID=A0A024GQN7_9STRA|nr:unnamed protein product [Albugo candida]|eukprot:CCI49096.1 unnamed protein product [Albugo candida]